MLAEKLLPLIVKRAEEVFAVEGGAGEDGKDRVKDYEDYAVEGGAECGEFRDIAAREDEAVGEGDERGDW